MISRICERSYAKGVIRPTGSLSCAAEHPLMNRAMVAVSSHAAESPLHCHVHVCTPGKGRRRCVRCVKGTNVSDRVEAESDVLIGCLPTRRYSQNDRGPGDAEIVCHGNNLP
jgi:hypothetical protein